MSSFDDATNIVKAMLLLWGDFKRSTPQKPKERDTLSANCLRNQFAQIEIFRRIVNEKEETFEQTEDRLYKEWMSEVKLKKIREKIEEDNI